MTETLGSLIHLRGALAISIHDTWNGYSPHAPVSAVYDLILLSRGVYAGPARFSTGSEETRLVDVRLPAKAAERFLDALATAPLGRVPVAAAVTVMTDHYPHIEVALHVGPRETSSLGGFVILSSDSQEDDMTPWRVLVGGETWWTGSPDIYKALRALDRPLQRRVLKEMTGEKW